MDTTQTSYSGTGPLAGPATTGNSSTSRGAGAFRRSCDNRMLGGVCAGLANTLNIDVALVRVLAVVLAVVTNGVGALAYLVAWLIVPEEGTETTALGAVLRR